MYNQEKVEQFKKYATDEYNRSLAIEDIAVVTKTERTDGDFVQIGLRPLIEDEFLIVPNFEPKLPGVGRMVAAGEMDFLINALVEDDKIKVENFDEDIRDFPKHAFEFTEAVILFSTKFYVEIFTKLMPRIEYGAGHPTLDGRYKLISVPEKVLGSKIIIIGMDAIRWKKQLFENGETLDINIRPATEFGKVDITVRSVNKLEFVDTERIKILEVEEK